MTFGSNLRTEENEARTEELKRLVADCGDDLDAKCRRILSVCREDWWGVPYVERAEPEPEPEPGPAPFVYPPARELLYEVECAERQFLEFVRRSA
jgi:hypothetical protein